MKKESLMIISMGFALFSMFFGSGNLVFPIAVGLESEGHYILASLGVLCTCVIFPFLGMLGMTLYKGQLYNFFACFGRQGVFFFSFLALALMGPFGVLARCLTVIHGALLFVFPEASLQMTSCLVCTLIFFLARKKNRIVGILGTILTPFLLLAIAAIAFFGFSQGTVQEPMNFDGWKAFKIGFFRGYQTMDLVASFFFSGFVIKHLYEGDATESNENALLKIFINSSILGAGLLYAVYFALVLMGWLYASELSQIAPQEMLGQIALQSLGTLGGPCVCLTVIFACLTTAIALASLFAEFLRKEVAQEKIGNNLALVITLLIAFLVSNLEFAGIANFLGPILEAIYPALISLTVVNIVCKLYDLKSSHWPFTVALIAKLCWI